MCNKRFTASLETPTVQVCLLSPFTAHPTLSSTYNPCAKMSLQRMPQIDPWDTHMDIIWISAPAVTFLQWKQFRLPKFWSSYTAPELLCAAQHTDCSSTQPSAHKRSQVSPRERIALIGLTGPSIFSVVDVVFNWVCCYWHTKSKGKKKNQFAEKMRPKSQHRGGDMQHTACRSHWSAQYQPLPDLQQRFCQKFSAYGRLFKK